MNIFILFLYTFFLPGEQEVENMCLRYPEITVRTDVEVLKAEWHDILIVGDIENRSDDIKVEAKIDSDFKHYDTLQIFWKDNEISVEDRILQLFSKPHVMSLAVHLIDVDESRFSGVDRLELRFRFQRFEATGETNISVLPGMQDKYANYAPPEAVINITESGIDKIRVYYQDQYCRFHSKTVRQ